MLLVVALASVCALHDTRPTRQKHHVSGLHSNTSFLPRGSAHRKVKAACGPEANAAALKRAQCSAWCDWVRQSPHRARAGYRHRIFCRWCACTPRCDGEGEGPVRMDGLTPPVSLADVHQAVGVIAETAARLQPPPLPALVVLLDAVSHNAEQAMLRVGRSTANVLSLFSGYGSIGTEPAQILAYARALTCAPQPPRHVCEVGLFQGHSAAIFLALTRGEARYTVIDPLEFGFSHSVVDHLLTLFPGRAITLLHGTSAEQLDAAKVPGLASCDV